MQKSITVIFIIFHLAVYSETEKSSYTEKRRSMLWQGDVTSVYPEKGKMAISLFHSPKNILFEDFKKDLLNQKKFTLWQKGTDKKIGSFWVRSVIQEEKNKYKYFVRVTGDFKSSSTALKKLVSTNVYIAAFGDETLYVEPLRYFDNRITPPVKTYIHPKDKKEMLFVESGFFIYGQGKNALLDNYNPNFYTPSENNLGDIPSFYMDKYEVTNQEYDKYLKETNSPYPLHWVAGNFPKEEKNHPVNNLSYREVEGYAVWAGKRLPTEWEWEKAARGMGYFSQTNRDESVNYEIKDTRFPFSDKFDPELCNTRETGIGKTVSVYELSEKGQSPYGIIGMCGNVSEWTSSWYDAYPNHYIKNHSFGKQFKVIRGGAFYDTAKQATVYYRGFGGIPNLAKDRKAGFRLVIDSKSN
ncbi:MAG: formylglycine-generating enzyme family protein [Leptospiraceae bacterium]|nr:formylglycine-generating enzyme family protein [Leptospiraceae bacterium]